MNTHSHIKDLFLTDERDNISGKAAHPLRIFFQLAVILLQLFLSVVQFGYIGGSDLRICFAVLGSHVLLRKVPCTAILQKHNIIILTLCRRTVSQAFLHFRQTLQISAGKGKNQPVHLVIA